MERLVLALTNQGNLVFDPFMGVGSSGVASLHNKRKYLGCELDKLYSHEAKDRLERTLKGQEVFREDTAIYDPKNSNLSQIPDEWKS